MTNNPIDTNQAGEELSRLLERYRAATVGLPSNTSVKDIERDILVFIRTEQKKLLDNLEKKSTHYTPDGLVADGLDPWAVSVSTICDERNKLEAEL